MKTNRAWKSAMIVAGGSMLMGSGNCMPDNFLVDTWGSVLTTIADTTAEVVILDRILPLITNDQAAE